MRAVADYQQLFTNAWQKQPKLNAVLASLVQPSVAGQGLLSGLPAAFDLDSAIGAQLDAVGVRVGLSRQVRTPLANTFFSFDTALLGFDQGYIAGPYDATTGVVSLSDDYYRKLLRVKIMANAWNGSNGQAQSIFSSLAEPGTLLIYQDNQDLSITLGIAGHIPSAVLRVLITGGYIPLKPAAVRAYYQVTSVEGAPLFGFDVENANVSGFGVGAIGLPL